MSLTADIQQTSVQGLVTLYTLDARRLGGEIYRFHGHNDGIIRWQGQDYHAIAISAEGLEMRSDGKASSPTLSIVNHLNGIQGAISALCQRFDDFAGAKLTVTQTLAQYLASNDAQNYKQQIWYIEQKTADDPQGIVQFELSNPTDFEGLKIPVRNITAYCHWAVCGRYRGEECGYTGTKRYTQDGKPTTDPIQDKCSGLFAHCRLRNNEGRFGGFVAAGLV